MLVGFLPFVINSSIFATKISLSLVGPPCSIRPGTRVPFPLELGRWNAIRCQLSMNKLEHVQPALGRPNYIVSVIYPCVYQDRVGLNIAGNTDNHAPADTADWSKVRA